jgi:hypothetical protein
MVGPGRAPQHEKSSVIMRTRSTFAAIAFMSYASAPWMSLGTIADGGAKTPTFELGPPTRTAFESSMKNVVRLGRIELGTCCRSISIPSAIFAKSASAAMTVARHVGSANAVLSRSGESGAPMSSASVTPRRTA